MHIIRNLTIIGTSHIAKQSIEEVKEIIEKTRPEIIALELDVKRFHRLVSKEKTKLKFSDIRKKGFLLNLIGAYIERYLGKKVGVMPGAEMKEAIHLARKHKIKLALIDQDIEITLRKLKARFTLKEKLRLLKNIFLAPFTAKKLSIDLTKVPEQKFINKLTNKVRQEYPSIYTTLISERDEVMSSRLFELMQSNEKVLAVVGAGHISGIKRLITWKLARKK
ncbi:TraB family protein [Candidatus Woesearchaeota archaeon]|nr:TraB family protein [Candidatus Woesearchaeota archaeon]